MSWYGGRHYPQNNINKLPALKQNKNHTVKDPLQWCKSGVFQPEAFNEPNRQWSSVLADIVLHPEQKAIYLLNLEQAHTSFFFFFENGFSGVTYLHFGELCLKKKRLCNYLNCKVTELPY